MSRDYYASGAPFLYTGGESGSGMDCLQLRHPPGPFHYLISEQAKSLVALQELQNEVGALLEFRDVVIETFPNLRTKLASSNPSTMTSSTSNIPVAARWEPGVRVRRKINNKDEVSRSSSKKSGESAIQDSGFSTETSSKETHSASSSAPPASAPSASSAEAEDELLNLLEVIHRKGTRLKDDLEALQGTLRDQNDTCEEEDFRKVLFRASADDVRQLREERDLLLDRVAEMEAEVLAGRVHTSRLQEDLENLLAAKNDLEEQLKAVVTQRGEVNSRIHDLHLQFVAKSGRTVVVDSGGVRNSSPSSQRSTRRCEKVSGLDSVLGDRIYKVKVPDTRKVAAVLKEHDPVVLQRHLLNSLVHNQVLQQQLDTASRTEVSLVDRLDRAREENEDLQFQLEDRNIELEGTRARVRQLELLHKSTPPKSPDIIPASDSTTANSDLAMTRTGISTASMKAMSPLNLQGDHSSSTESAHDQAAAETAAKRRPSRIPLVKSAAPKPPVGGKRSPAPAARSRSGGSSPGRSYSATSWRTRTPDAPSSSLPKSRGGSLTTARDSLTGKPNATSRSPATSMSRTTQHHQRKASTASVRRTPSVRDSPEAKMDSSCTKRKSHSPWAPSLCKPEAEQYPDSLDKTGSSPPADTSGGQHFQTANNFLWDVGTNNHYYDSIDHNLHSNLYQQNGEDLAECDSLEKQLSDLSVNK